MAHIGPNCHEICPKCFELLSPIEEVSIGHIIAPEGAVGSISKCDLCKEGYSRARGHHIDSDRAELLKEYVQRSLKKGFEEYGSDAPYSEEEHMKMQEFAKKFLTKVFADHLPTPEVTVTSDPDDPTRILATATLPAYMIPREEYMKKPIRAMEYIQRSGGGGHPLTNENASYMGIGHGDTVLIVHKRDLVALLQKVHRGDSRAIPVVEALLMQWDHFVDREGLDG